MKLLQLVGCLSLLAASSLAVPSMARAQSAASAPEAAAQASAVADVPVLAKEPVAGHLNPGQRVLVDDGSCPVGQIKELTGGTNRNCGPNSALLDTTQCRHASGGPRISRCIARP